MAHPYVRLIKPNRTCRAKLIEGEVDMDVNYGLEPEEIEQGFILTCQSHPRTEKVVVDFDVKYLTRKQYPS